MAAALTDWLGPLIEHDLKEAIEWKEVRGFTSKDFSNLFTDDGSSLSIRCRADAAQSRIVQILEISQNSKCRLSDGHTVVKARLLPDARKALQEDGKAASQLARGMQLSIPDFSIRVTALGKMDERVQLHLNHVKLHDPTEHVTYGKPKEVSDLTSIKTLMEKLQAVSKEPTGERPATGTGADASSQLSLGNATQGSRYDGTSQAFATQAVPHGRRHNQAPGAINLAAPVMPTRTGSGLGSQPTIGKNGFKNPDPLGLLLQLHPMPGPSRPVLNAAPNGIGRRDQPPVARHAGAEADRQPLLGTTPSTTRQEQAARRINHIDLEEANSTAESAESDESAANSPLPADEEEPASQAAPTEHPETEDQATLSTRVANEENVDKIVVQGIATLEAHRTGDAPISPSPIVKSESRSPVHTSSPREMSDTSADTVPKSSRNTTTAPWHGISRLRRSQCLVPQDQQSLLSSKQSWNPPEPGTQFPTPNIPIAYLKQIEQSRSEKNDMRREEAHAAADASSNAPSSPQSASSLSPSPTPDEQIFDWNPSSPIPGHDNILPPDSSDTDAAHQMQTRLERQLDSVTRESATRSREARSSPMQGSSRPISRHQPMYAMPQTSEMRSSAIAAHQPKTRVDELPILLQPSTLSQSDFRSPANGPHLSPAALMSHRETDPIRRRDDIQSTYTPAFQSAQGIQTPMFLDGTRNSPPPMRITASDADKMAEAQIQEDFRVSTEKKNKTRPTSTKEASPSSPLDRSGSRLSDQEMDVDSTTPPPQVLGKRLPASPANTDRRPRKSRFGFSQEDPVSQNPAYTVGAERRRFMDERKQGNRQQTEQVSTKQSDQAAATDSTPRAPRENNLGSGENMVSSSPPLPAGRVSAVPSPQENAQVYGPVGDIQPGLNVGHCLAEETTTRHEGPRQSSQRHQFELTPTYESLHSEFCAAYKDYQGSLKHFTNLINDIGRSMNPPHPFLWDDFVIRNMTDYLPHSVECLQSGERPISYDTFYAKKITRPQYTQGILTAERLDNLFSLHGKSLEGSPRSRGRNTGNRRGQDSPLIDRYVPPPHPPSSASPAPSVAGATQARKQKNGLFMMSFGSGSDRRTTSEQKGNAFVQGDDPIPKGPKNYRPTSSAAPTPNLNDDARRSLPSDPRTTNRAPNAPNGRMSSASFSCRGSTSEFNHFHESWQSLSSVKEDGNSNDGKQRRINVIAWNLDPVGSR